MLGVAPVLKKADRELCMQLLSEKKCCSLANFLWVQSRQFRIVASIKRFLFGEKTFNLHWRTKVLKESVQLPNANNCFCSYLRISTLSQILLLVLNCISSTCCGGIFTLFALFPPFAYLVWKSCAANARLF